MRKDIIQVLVIGREEIFSRASDLIFGLGRKLDILIKVDNTTTHDAFRMMLRKKYNKIIWIRGNPANLPTTMFEKEKPECLVV